MEFTELLTFGVFGRNFNNDGKAIPRDIFSWTGFKVISNTSVWILIFILFASSYYFSH